MNDLVSLLLKVQEVEAALDNTRRLERELLKKKDAAYRSLADGHIEALSACPQEVIAKVLRYFREREREVSGIERIWD